MCYKTVGIQYRDSALLPNQKQAPFLQVKMHSVLYKIYVAIVIIFNAPVMTFVIIVAIQAVFVQKISMRMMIV